MNKTRHALTTGLKLATCLIAILAIGYTQTWVESFGASYGGPLRTQLGDLFDGPFLAGRSDMFEGPRGESLYYPRYSWDTEQGWAFMLALALVPIGLYLWYTLWTVPRRRERLLAAELWPMYRLVRSPHRLTKKHKRHPSGAPAWH